MTTSSSQQLERQAVVSIKPSIHAETTVDAAPQPASCDHLHDTTTRYDPDEKVLTFLLVCPVCRTEKVVESQHYEPRFQPLAA